MAVVGSRARHRRPGARWPASMARDLAAWGATVVSGLARGIDTAAHEGALDGRRPHRGRAGLGLDRMYPPENERLAGRIAAQGRRRLRVRRSGTPPLPEHFPRRNRVIAGWSRAVVVVEAAARSGALEHRALRARTRGATCWPCPGHPDAARRPRAPTS